MEVYRSVYFLAEGFPLADRLRQLYDATLPASDSLSCLLAPEDLRGEVAAWGGPHWTVLDALTCRDPDRFSAVVHDVCRQFAVPEIRPKALKILARTFLVIACEVTGFTELRAALIRATRDLIARAPLADEEQQKAVWWIHRVSRDPDSDLAALEYALSRYQAAGSPPLPSSRHFRLGYLQRLCKEIR